MPRESRFLTTGWLAGVALLAIIPFLLGEYHRFLLTEILIWGLFAISFNVIFGYTGILSFGQAMFFGIGAYAVAFVLTKTSLGLAPALLLGTFAATAWGAFIGLFAIRLTGHYFVIVTIIFSLALFFLCLNLSGVTGGDTGLPFEVPASSLGPLRFSLYDSLTNYYFVLAFTLLPFAAYWLVIRSPLGLVFMAVRDNKERTRYLGYNPAWYRFVSFTFAAGLAGLAGALYALTTRYANALLLHWMVSGEAVVWTIVGGAGTLLGPVFGTVGLLILEDYISSWNERIYPIIVGSILIGIIIVAPEGLVGIVKRRLLPRGARQPWGWLRKPAPRQGQQIPSDVMPDPHSAGLLAELYEETRAAAHASAAPLLEVKGLSKEFSKLKALDRVELTVLGQADGQGVSAIIGPNGSGKTTLFTVITGGGRPSAGKIVYSDEDITGMSPSRIANKGIIRSFQHTSVFWNLSVEDNIKLGLMAWGSGGVRDLLASQFRQADFHRKTDIVLNVIGLKNYRDKLARELSHGMQRLLEIGLVLAARPRLLFMDEPTAGLSEEATHVMVEVIRIIATHIPVVLIEHDLGVVRDLAREVLVLADGRVIARGTAEEVESQEVVRAAFWKGGRV